MADTTTDAAPADAPTPEDDPEVQRMLAEVARLSDEIRRYQPNLKERLSLYLQLRSRNVPHGTIARHAKVTSEAVRLAVHKHLAKQSEAREKSAG